jgi:hypothetical protein
MELKLVNQHNSDTMSNNINRRSMREQVASSKGTEWMVKSYIAWQQSSPLASEPKRDSASFLKLVSQFQPRETQVRRAMAFSFRVIVVIVGLLLIGKSRW